MWRIPNCNKVEIRIEKLLCCKTTEASGVCGDESMIYCKTFGSLHKNEIRNVQI